MKKIIAILLVAVMLLSLVPAPATATSYSDILGIDETQYDMESYYQHLWSNYNSNVHGLLWDAVCGKQYYVYPQVVEEIGNDGWIDFASNITEEQLTRDRYIEILSNLLVMMDYNTKDLIAEQVNADTAKTFRDYVVDVTGILTQTISLDAAFGSHVTKQMKKISTAMNLTWGFADFTINTIETYESLDRTLRQYENHQEFLSAIANNTSDSTLKEAALALSDTADKAFYCKVNAVADTASDLAGYLGNDVFFDTIVLEYMASDASVLGLSQDDVAVLGVLKSAYEYVGTLQLAADLGVFAGDAIIGISDVMNRFNEMRALTEVRNALIQQMTSYRDSITSVNDIEEIGKLCSLLKNLIYVNFRGEYCVHEMCVQDAQLYSLVIKINGQAETHDRVYEQAKENTKIYAWIVDTISPVLEFYRTNNSAIPDIREIPSVIEYWINLNGSFCYAIPYNTGASFYYLRSSNYNIQVLDIILNTDGTRAKVNCCYESDGVNYYGYYNMFHNGKKWYLSMDIYGLASMTLTESDFDYSTRAIGEFYFSYQEEYAHLIIHQIENGKVIYSLEGNHSNILNYCQQGENLCADFDSKTGEFLDIGNGKKQFHYYTEDDCWEFCAIRAMRVAD